MINKFIKSIRYLNVRDFFDVLFLPFYLIFSLVYKIILLVIKKRIWLVCEGRNDARDNGYVFYKYIREKHPEVPVYYVIDKKCEAYDKVKDLGNIIQFGSLKHWIYYLCASKNIIIHKAGNPNEKIFYVLHYYGIINGHRIFLQHGVTMNNVKYLYYKKTRFELFICGAKPEYEYIKKNFGYPKQNICYLGFPRFDNLYNRKINKKQIAIFPTWRSWLKDLKSVEEFKKTDYYKKYQSLLNNDDLIKYLEKRGITLYFYLHKNVDRFSKAFDSKCNNIKIISSNMSIILNLIAESAMIVTDYSSISIDCAYMKKPLIYYQFDKKKFRLSHLEEGYFSYEKMGFGPVVLNENELVRKLINYCDSGFKMESKYLQNVDNFFTIRDNKNCERIYNKIKTLDRKEG